MAAADAAQRDRLPMYDIELYTAATTNPYGVRQNYFDDPEAFVETELDRAVTLGFAVVCMRNPGGKKYGETSASYDLSGAEDWPDPIRTFYLTRFKEMVEERNLRAWVYGGANWPTPSTSTTSHPPIPDPDVESDEIDRFADADRTCGFEGRFFDAVANTMDVYSTNRTDAMNDLAGYLWDVHGMRVGIESIPGNDADYADPPTGLDAVRSPYFENYILADYLFDPGDWMAAFRPPFVVPVGVQMRVVLRAPDAANAEIIALGGLTAAAATLHGLGWIVHSDNSVDTPTASSIAGVHEAGPPDEEPPSEVFVNNRGYRGRDWRRMRV